MLLSSGPETGVGWLLLILINIHGLNKYVLLVFLRCTNEVPKSTNKRNVKQPSPGRKKSMRSGNNKVLGSGKGGVYAALHLS